MREVYSHAPEHYGSKGTATVTHLAPLPVVATWIGRPEQTVRNWCSQGKVRHAKVNGRLEVSPLDCLRVATAAELVPGGWRGTTRTQRD